MHTMLTVVASNVNFSAAAATLPPQCEVHVVGDGKIAVFWLMLMRGLQHTPERVRTSMVITNNLRLLGRFHGDNSRRVWDRRRR